MPIRYTDSSFRYFDERLKEQRVARASAVGEILSGLNSEDRVEMSMEQIYHGMAEAIIDRQGERVLRLAKLGSLDLQDEVISKRAVSHVERVRDLRRMEKNRAKYSL
jgi:predicted metalloprotease